MTTTAMALIATLESESKICVTPYIIIIGKYTGFLLKKQGANKITMF